MTALTRQGSTHTFPDSVTAIPVDLDSVDSLTSALQGQDAVVSVVGNGVFDKQHNLVEAAVKAGVKRFIPSEFGSNTPHEKTRTIPTFAPKIAIQKELEDKAKTTPLTYTLIINGPFLDWGLKVGFVLNVKGKSAQLLDGGDRVFSATTLSGVGKAVAGVLKHPDETKNRAVYVQETATTLKDLLEKAKKAAGPDGWTVEEVPVANLIAAANEELKKPNPNPAVWAYPYVKAAIWGEGYGSHFEKLDNELLGIKELSDGELQALVDSIAKA